MFYRDDALVHAVDIPETGSKIPAEIYQGTLSISANARVPGEVVMPGLEIVVEIDPEGTSNPATGIAGRIPQTGRMAIDVREVPPLDLTIVPFLWQENPDYTVVTKTENLTGDDDLFWRTRDLLPVGALNLTVREPVWTTFNPGFQRRGELIEELHAIRTMDGAASHYMGIIDHGGTAISPGFTSLASLDGETIAHELGQNLSLGHAPCGTQSALDPYFPYKDGSIGSRGYDLRNNRLIHPDTPDLMSYCGPGWISDYNFASALNYRQTGEVFRVSSDASPTSTLLLWGGVDAQGVPVLNPAFVVNTPPSLPETTGPYQLTGEDKDGGVLFALRFGMPEIADGASVGAFAFTMPVKLEWADNLARITLSGPEGLVTMDRAGRRAAALVTDHGSGRVRGILRDWPDPSQPSKAVLRGFPEPGLEVVVSRGIPDAASWRR